jgi:hypothetical protein
LTFICTLHIFLTIFFSAFCTILKRTIDELVNVYSFLHFSHVYGLLKLNNYSCQNWKNINFFGFSTLVC